MYPFKVQEIYEICIHHRMAEMSKLTKKLPHILIFVVSTLKNLLVIFNLIVIPNFTLPHKKIVKLIVGYLYNNHRQILHIQHNRYTTEKITKT